MRFIETKLAGAFVIEPQLFEDERGFFTRTFSQREFLQHGCNPELLECNVSFNNRAGTLRGMHFQMTPYAQAKLVRCTAGAIWDAIIDLRPGSPTLRQWVGVELTAGNHRALYIPEGFAHGFITLADETEVFYQMGGVYNAEAARGVRWNDPAFGIEWPRQVAVINDRDANYADFVVERAG
jgi:dTDP-4-dehydrorhamnose 3,5-epimerase